MSLDATSTSTITPQPAGGPVTMTYAAGAATVIAVSGGLRSDGFAALHHVVTEALDRGDRQLVLDVHEVDVIEPDALGLLWAALRGVRRRGGTLAAAGARPSLRSALEALSSGGLATYPTVSAALEATRDPDARS